MSARSLPRAIVANVAQRLASTSKEAQRALPDSKGGETPKQLQTYATNVSTYFTIADGVTHLLYSAENWVRIRLTLETAGPVAWGTAANLEPVLSGRGIVMDTDKEYEAYLSKGARIYIISETVNRVSVIVEPVPWFEQISMELNHGMALGRNAIAQAAQLVTSAVQTLRTGITPATSQSGTPVHQLPAPPPVSIPRPRLTGIRPPGKVR